MKKNRISSFSLLTLGLMLTTALEARPPNVVLSLALEAHFMRLRISIVSPKRA